MDKKVMLYLLLFVVTLFSGCGYFSAFSPRICGMFDVQKQQNNVSFAVKQGGKIVLGMPKEKVMEAWGEPAYDDLEMNRWRYHAVGFNVSYLIIFENNTIKNIQESVFEKKYECRSNDI